MKLPWRLLRYIPPGLLTVAKKTTSARFRLWLRERTGGDASSIPDTYIRVPDGRKFHIGPDLIYWAIYQGLEFEAETTSVVRLLVPRGVTVIDAGANHGWYATLFGQLVGDEGRVYAFEPIPATHERLQEHLSLNGLEGRVISERAALGDSVGEITLHVFDGLSHGRSSVSTQGRDDHTRVSAAVHTIDGYLSSRGSGPVELLKCDVEGAELAVLRGAAGLLDREDAPIVLLEMNDQTCAAMGYTTAELRDCLAGYGYDHFYRVAGIRSIERIVNDRQLAETELLIACKGRRVDERVNGVGRAAA